jgi:hypothetical protein
MDTRYVVTAVAGLVAVSLVYSFSRRIRKRQPPGPRQLPFIGNAHQLPVQTPWITFSQWARVYGLSSQDFEFQSTKFADLIFAGDLIFLNIMGQPAVLVSSRKVASDLMEKRAIIYSDRPYMVRHAQIQIPVLLHRNSSHLQEMANLYVSFDEPARSSYFNVILAVVSTSNLFYYHTGSSGDNNADSWHKISLRTMSVAMLRFRRKKRISSFAISLKTPTLCNRSYDCKRLLTN